MGRNIKNYRHLKLSFQNGYMYCLKCFFNTFMDNKLKKVIEITENKVMKALRELNNYTQEYVASFLDINQNSYYKLESGQTRLTVDRMKKLAELYNVDPEVFLSNSVSVIHCNKGTGSNSNSGYIKTYTNSTNDEQKVFYEKLLSEKNEQIKILHDQLIELKQKEKRFLNMLEKITSKA